MRHAAAGVSTSFLAAAFASPHVVLQLYAARLMSFFLRHGLLTDFVAGFYVYASALKYTPIAGRQAFVLLTQYLNFPKRTERKLKQTGSRKSEVKNKAKLRDRSVIRAD